MNFSCTLRMTFQGERLKVEGSKTDYVHLSFP